MLRSYPRWKPVTLLVLLALLLLFPASDLVAQSGPSRAYPLRDYGHVFLAYALAWLLLLGWVVRIVRQMARVEARLTAMEEEAGIGV
ncbi:MAG: hypothetical protein WEA09_01910 [Gemmatimonadota bacterium]